ncbi:MAG TPA: DUF3987 domain-containing protein [Methylomirabilota bacterium]|nr:DUF3987 domain-containing protein [Methylomirabilota bacterium]
MEAEAWAQEREDAPPAYHCPAELWIGPWADVSALLGIRDWRVWVGVTAALSARAHRNVHVDYYGPLFGQGYYLLVAASSHGKSLCTRLCKALLPNDYEVFTSVESGQALAESLADIRRDEHGKILHPINGRPTCLVVNEWSLLLQGMDFHGSSLMERFNEIADAEPHIDLNRADKKGQGKIRIFTPTLTICATTTQRLYQAAVKDRHITSGFINRHLILPGARTPWRYNSPTERFDLDALRLYAHSLPLAHTFGLGQPLSELYTREAWELDDAFGRASLEPLHNADSPTDTEDVYKRLHVYNRRIAALYAWATGSNYIRIPHVQAAHAVIRTSYRFLQELHESLTSDLPIVQRAAATLENLILKKVHDNPGTSKQTICQQLKRHGGFSAVSRAIENLIQAGALQIKLEGLRNKSKCLFLSHRFN